MKSILMTIGSAALFASAISALPTGTAPRQAGQSAHITQKTGDGDASIGFDVPINVLFVTAQSAPQAENGVSAETTTGFFCQAFSDAQGKQPLATVFSDTEVSFTDKSDGSVGSVASDAVPIGAYCCSTSAAGAEQCQGISSSNNGGNNGKNNGKNGHNRGSNNAGSGAAATSTSTSSASSSTPSVRVQIDGDNGESGAQGEVRADGVLQVLGAPFFSEVDAAFIVDAEGVKNPTCQAFADAQGTQKVGQPFGTESEQLNGGSGKNVVVKGMKCQAN